MTEQYAQQSEQTQETPQTQQQADLSTELRELGQQLEQAFRGVVENENAKKLQRDFVSGLREIGTQMQTGLNSFKENPRVQTLTERGQQVMHQAQESQASRDFQESLVRSVAFLREQIASFNERQKAGMVDPAGDTQNVTIEHEEEAPATGETTRLDSDKSE